MQNPLPIWLGVGGTLQSFARAGALGLPLMVAIIGGDPSLECTSTGLFDRATVRVREQKARTADWCPL